MIVAVVLSDPATHSLMSVRRPSMLKRAACMLALHQATAAFQAALPFQAARYCQCKFRPTLLMRSCANDLHSRPDVVDRACQAFLISGMSLLSMPAIARARAGPLGVIDDLLADCPSTSNCASSMDDRPGCWQEPWTYDVSTDAAHNLLKNHVSNLAGASLVSETDRYLRYAIEDRGAVDDCEFYFTPSDVTIQFRSARRGGQADRGRNLKRMEKIRIALGFEKVPVLRNRRRAFVFLTSPWDSFGPSGYQDGVPEEAPEIYGDVNPEAPVWEQRNPFMAPGRKLVAD